METTALTDNKTVMQHKLSDNAIWERQHKSKAQPIPKGWAFLLSPTSHHLSPQLLHLKCLSLILEARSQAVTVTDGDMGEITVKLVDWHKGHLEVWVACHRRRAVKLAAPSSVSYFKIWSLTFAFSSSDMASKDSLLISGKPRTYPPHPMCSPFQVRGRTDAYA